MANGQDEMKRIIICKYCNKPEYYGKMVWLNGRCECRDCYKNHYREVFRKYYRWNDLDGKRPTVEEYNEQEGIK